MRIFRNTLRFWLPIASAITLLCGLIYVIAQQNIRLGANDPQIQMAEDAALAMKDNIPATSLVPSQKVEISQSLAPFVMIFDPQGKVLASNAVLRGEIPKVPTGVFDYVRQHGEDRITWQPESGVRVAAIIIGTQPESNGFVLAGRSLREAESRTDMLLLQAGIGWIITMVVSFGLVVALEILPFTRSKP